MNLFVAEIGGRAVAVFDGADWEFADWYVNSPVFRMDIQELDTQGKALWDGEEEISLRSASPEEAQRWYDARAPLLQ